MALKDDIKKALNKPAPKWAQVLPGGNRSKVPDVSVFTKKLAKTPTLDVSKNIKNPAGRAAASIGEGMVNIPSKLMRNYGQTFTDIGNGNIYTGKGARQFLARTGENALDVLSMGKGKAAFQLGGKFAKGAVPFSEILKQSVRQGANTGGLYGAGYGLTGELQKDQTSARQVLYQALQNGAIGSVFGGVLGGALPVASALPGAIRRSINNRIPGNWNKANAGNGPTVSQLIRDVAEAMPRPGMSIQDVSKKQRGFAETVSKSPLTDKKVVSLLQDANYTPEKNDALVKRATALVANDIDKATEIALRGDDNMSVATASELIKKYQNDGNFTAAANLTKEIATKLTDAGRFIQAASLYNKLTPQGILRYANNELAPHGLELDENDVKVLTEMAKKAGSLTGEDKIIATGKMLQKVQELVPSSFMDKLVTVWKAGLLTNPTTHIANVGGNVTMTGLEALKDIPATGLDMAASLFTGKRTKTLPSLGAMGSGAIQGAKKAGTFLKTGVDVDQTLGKIDYKQVNLPPVLKQYTQAVFRTLGATDKVFKETLLKKSLHEQAVVDGINRGLSGAQLAEHAKNLYQNPSVQMVETATKDALYGTFNSPNKAAQALGNSAAMNIVAPFKRTPMNIANAILDYSPIGAGKTIYKGLNGSGQRDIVEGLSRALIGSGIIGAGYGLGKSGMMTGNYPQNETERNLWEATGRQPGALKVDDNWQSLNRVSPVGNLLSIGSGMADLGRIKPEDVPLAMLSTAGGNLLNQTYLQGVSSLLNAVQDPKRYASSWAENLAKGVIPSVVGAAARYVDPTKRQTNSIGEAIQSRIPGMSQNLLPKVDVFGRKIQNESNPFINPFNTTKAKDTPVTNEIWRLYKNYAGVSLGDPNQSASIGQGLKVELTPEEYTAYQQKTGGVFGNLLNTLISSKQYKGLSDYDKSKAINETVSKVRQMWVMQNARNLQGFPDVYNQIQQQVKLRTPSFFTK